MVPRTDFVTIYSNTRIKPHSGSQLLMEVNNQFPVCVAAQHGRVAIMEDMFKTASKEALLDYQDGQKMTPLLHAVQR